MRGFTDEIDKSISGSLQRLDSVAVERLALASPWRADLGHATAK
ncbi:hypothetical protein [Limosilactobacillus sp.]|nr:hypothetical protein [Limosilactobacillus sp.]